MFAQSFGVVKTPSLDRHQSTQSASRGLSRFYRAIASVCVGLVAITAVASPAAAQVRVGAFVGGEHESSWDEFLVIGADARLGMAKYNIDLNPRISYFLRDGLTRLQFDFNVIKPLMLASKSRIVPFVGTGVALESTKTDDELVDNETHVGFNYIVGGTLATSSRIQPFAQFVYTVLNESPNNAVISVGAHFNFGKSK